MMTKGVIVEKLRWCATLVGLLDCGLDDKLLQWRLC